MESGGGYAKFWLTPIVRLAGSVGLRGPDLREIRRLVEAHAGEFLEKWNEHFQR